MVNLNSCGFHAYPATHDPDSMLIDSSDATTAHLYDVYGRYMATGQFIDSCTDKGIASQSFEELTKCRFKTKLSIYPAGIKAIQTKLAKARGDTGKSDAGTSAALTGASSAEGQNKLVPPDMAALSQMPLSLPDDSARRIALVVGNSSYLYLPRLDNPRNDAELIAQTLVRLRFELVGDKALLDLNQAEFAETVKHFSEVLHRERAAKRSVVALFYYAGHGLQVRGDNYLLPVDANPTREGDIDFQTLNVNVVLRQMESAATALNMVILDACRNNPFGGRGLRSSGNGLAEMRAPEGTLIAFATQSGNVAQDGLAGGNSPFAQALAWGLQQPGLDQFGTFNAVAVQVKKMTSGAQQPWMSNSPIEGRFFFVSPQ